MAALPSECVSKTVTPSAAMIEVLVDGARYGDMEDVQSALQHSVAVNSVDSLGRTGLLQHHFNLHTRYTCDFQSDLFYSSAHGSS